MTCMRGVQSNAVLRNAFSSRCCVHVSILVKLAIPDHRWGLCGSHSFNPKHTEVGVNPPQWEAGQHIEQKEEPACAGNMPNASRTRKRGKPEATH